MNVSIFCEIQRFVQYQIQSSPLSLDLPLPVYTSNSKTSFYKYIYTDIDIDTMFVQNNIKLKDSTLLLFDFFSNRRGI